MGSSKYVLDGKNKRNNVPEYLEKRIKEIDSKKEESNSIVVGTYNNLVFGFGVDKDGNTYIEDEIIPAKKEKKEIKRETIELKVEPIVEEDTNVLDLDNLRKMKKVDLIEIAQNMSLEYKGLNKESLIARIDDYVNS